MKKGFYCNIEAIHQEVTGSCIRVTVHKPDGEVTRFIVDCGIFQEPDYRCLNPRMPLDPTEIDFALVTHAHADHIGRLPMLTKMGFNGQIYCTETTAKIMKFALDDTYHVLKDDTKWGNPLLFHHNDVDDCMASVHPCKYGKKGRVVIDEDPDITVTFIMNGHLVGASMILVTIKHYAAEEDINLLFTGDYKSNNLFFDVPEISDKIKNKKITIISEATYGDTEPGKKAEKVFRKNITEWLENGGTLYLPVFALGRCQEMLYIIGSLKNEGLIDDSIPVYLEGKLATHYCNLFRKDKLNNDVKMMTNLYPSNFRIIDGDGGDSMSKKIRENNEQKIVLFTSGMCSYGPAQNWIPYGLKNEKVMIHLTGYPAEGTKARELFEAAEGHKVELSGNMKVIKRCKIMTTEEFSGHAKADDLIKLYKKFTDVEAVILNHGSDKAKECLKKRILEETDINSVGILGKTAYRVDAYGINKEIPNELYI